MKIHSTNYTDTFIQAAADCRAEKGEAPPEKTPRTAARAQYEMLINAPYRYTSDEILYETIAKPKGLSKEEYFSKGQPCLRAGALGQRYGWGSHHDHEGRVALYGKETAEYQRLMNDPGLRQLKAMSGRK